MLLYFFGHDSPSSGESIVRSIYTDVGQEVCIWGKINKTKQKKQWKCWLVICRRKRRKNYIVAIEDFLPDCKAATKARYDTDGGISTSRTSDKISQVLFSCSLSCALTHSLLFSLFLLFSFLYYFPPINIIYWASSCLDNGLCIEDKKVSIIISFLRSLQSGGKTDRQVKKL